MGICVVTQWKQYSLDLAGKNLKCSKTGFGWIVGGQSDGVTFYIDDVRHD